MDLASLSTPLTHIKGIGPLFAAKLEKLQLKTVKDLLYYFPFRYQDFSAIKPIAQLQPNEIATIHGTIEKLSVSKTKWKKYLVITARIVDESGKAEAVWFNQRFLLNQLKEGLAINIAGKVSFTGKRAQFQSPEFEIISRDSYIPRHTGRLVPIYSETKGITSKGIRFVMEKVLPIAKTSKEFLPESIMQQHTFPILAEAFVQMHKPESLLQTQQARKRFMYQDLFLLQLIKTNQKNEITRRVSYALPHTSKQISKYLSYIPFELTEGQQHALQDILQDIALPHATHRLLQGDVGSGKTVVAALAALVTASHGKQAVFMAPTEVLAQQHYHTFTNFFEEFEGGVGLLTASRTVLFLGKGLEREITKKELRAYIASGKIKIIIGTHAVIQKNISFNEVGLVIIDEQHRFGVAQRALLFDANNANLLEFGEQNTDDEKIVEKELSYTLQGIFFNVQDKLGRFARERQYADELEQQLKEKKIPYERESAIEVGGRKSNFADFIIDGKILIEVKAKPFFTKEDYAQTMRYLKSKNLKLGLLIDFQQKYLKAKRILNSSFVLFESNLHRSHRNYSPHLLSMSATPIPRTLALTLLGDLELSTINELPKNRKKIDTRIVPAQHRATAYAFVRSQIKEGRQVFVICPRIQPADPEQKLTPRQLAQLDVKNVEDEYKKLSKTVFPQLRVGMLHGQLKAIEKNTVMKKFKDHELDILVATSVIEVGVDVPNATLMIIEGSEHFGLSQLYQFRGRVGRAQHQSYCFLFTDSHSKITLDRLKALISAKNGFELAEMDLKFRGPGQFLGTEQTGLPDLAMEALQNPTMVKDVYESVQHLMQRDPQLHDHPLLATYIKLFEKQIHWE